jgi:hypothetical protein
LSAVKAAHATAVAQNQELLGKTKAEIQRKQDEDYATAIRAGQTKISDAISDSKQRELRDQGDKAGAEIEAIKHAAEKEKAAIHEANLKKAQELGLVDDTGAFKTGADHDKFAALSKQDIDQDAAINADTAAKVQQVTQARDEQMASKQKEMDFEIAEEKVRATIHDAIKQRIVLLELERQRALGLEADPKTAVGVGKDRINQLYDAREAVAQYQSGTTFGSFNPDAIRAAAGGGSQEHAAATAKNTQSMDATLKAMLRQLGEQGEGGAILLQ